MRILVNGQEINYEAGLSPGEIVPALEQVFREDRLVVIGIRVDGIAVTEDLVSILEKNQPQEVAITVVSLEEVVYSGLGHIGEGIPTLTAAIYKIVELLQSGNEGEGTLRFLDVISQLEEILTIFKHTVDYVTGLPVDADGRRFLDELNTFQQRVGELLGAWENRDFVLISDLLEYELVPQLETFQEQTAVLLQKIKL